MLGEYRLVVHLVDVVARQDDNEIRGIALDNVDVLGNGVCRSEIPLVLGDALRRGQNIETFIALVSKEIPAPIEVAYETMGFVLRRDADAPNPGVEGVREREVDDARLTAEEDRRLRPTVS